MKKLLAWVQKRPPREQIIIWMTVAVAIGTIGFLGHDWQQRKLLARAGELAGVKNEIKTLQAELQLRQQEVDRAAAQQVESKSRATLAARTQEQLSQSGRLSALVGELMRVAKDEGVEVMSIRPGDARDQGAYIELPIVIGLRARFRGLGEYLHQVQHLQQVVLVGRVRVDPSSNEDSTLTVQVDTVSFLGKA